MKIDAVIFDLDGTLLNTAPDLTSAVNHAVKTVGKDVVYSVEDVTAMVGNGVRNLITKALGEDVDVEKVASTLVPFKEYYAEHLTDDTYAYEGVIDLLKKLKAKGIKTAIVSNKYDSAVKALSEKFFGDLIDVAIGEMDGVPKKPDRALVDMAINELGVDPEGCYYVGDSDVDITTAYNADLPCICVAWGFKGKDFLVNFGATVICETVSDLEYLLT
jgi:phosphoglycolate phosphatase